jgi:hypothetical protein
MRMEGPIEVDLKVAIINDEEQTAGIVTIGMGMAHYPTREEMQERLAKFTADEMPNGFRLMNKREYFNAKVRELTGSRDRFAVPGGPDWDDVDAEDEDGTPV